MCQEGTKVVIEMGYIVCLCKFVLISVFLCIALSSKPCNSNYNDFPSQNSSELAYNHSTDFHLLKKIDSNLRQGKNNTHISLSESIFNSVKNIVSTFFYFEDTQVKEGSFIEGKISLYQ